MHSSTAQGSESRYRQDGKPRLQGPVPVSRRDFCWGSRSSSAQADRRRCMGSVLTDQPHSAARDLMEPLAHSSSRRSALPAQQTLPAHMDQAASGKQCAAQASTQCWSVEGEWVERKKCRHLTRTLRKKLQGENCSSRQDTAP